MEIPKHQIFLKSLILLPANSHAKMAPDNSIWRRSAVEAGSNQARSRALSSRRCPSFSVRRRSITKDSVDWIGRNSAITSAALRYGKRLPRRGALHQLRRGLIRADIAQDPPGGAKMRQTALAVHDPRISDFNAAKHRLDLALAITSHCWLADHLPEMSHDGLANRSRQPTGAPYPCR